MKLVFSCNKEQIRGQCLWVWQTIYLWWPAETNAKFEKCKMFETAEVVEKQKRSNYVIERSSEFESMICCMLYHSCTLSLYYLERGGRELTALFKNARYSMSKFALGITTFPFQGSLQFKFLVARTFSLICSPSKKLSSYRGAKLVLI